LNFYTSTTSSLSNSLSNYFNSSSMFISFSRNSNKLNGDLHPILRTLGQFLLTKINFYKFSICKWHPLRLVRILVKENILIVLICNPIIPKIYQAKNPIIGNIALRFCHHWRGRLMSLTSIWYFLKIRSSLVISFFTNSLVLVICSNISNLQSWSKIFWSAKFVDDFTKGCKCSWHLTNIGYKDFLSYFQQNQHFSPFQQMKILYEGSYTQDLALKKSYYGFSFYHKPFRMRGKNSTHWLPPL